MSERELEILRFVATGASNKEIAQKLFISTNTVKVHLRNIFAKIGVASRTEAAMYAVKAGVVVEAGREFQPDSQSLPEQSLLGESPASWDLFGIRPIWLAGIVIMILIGIVSATYFIGRDLASPDPQGEIIRWQTRAPLPTARLGLALVGYENRVYAFGGKTTKDVTAIAEYYDIARNAWVRASDKPVPVYEIGAVAIGGRIFIPGGRLSSGAVTDVLEIYDPLQNSWTRGASLPTALSAYALVAYEGHMYLFGGWDGISYVSTTYEYDPGQDAWKILQPMPTARGYLGAAVAGQKIYLVGGFDGKKALSSNEVFKPDLDPGQVNLWSEASELPNGVYAMGVTSVADIIYVVGGVQEGDASQYSTLQYSAQTDEWRTFNAPSNPPGAFIGLTNQGTNLYEIGGSIDQRPINNNQVYKALYTVSFPIISK